MNYQAQVLMTIYADTTHFTINSTAANPTRTWHKSVLEDPGLFHGILSIVALYMYSHVGITMVKEDLFFHRGEAMRIINDRLNNINGSDTSFLIASIATMLSFEVNGLPYSYKTRY